MENTSETHLIPKRRISYFRQRQKNRVFHQIAKFFADEAERRGLNRRILAERLQKDPAQITRWLSTPSNLTLDTISDLLLALDAEMDTRIVTFSERAKPNDCHDLIEQLAVATAHEAGSTARAVTIPGRDMSKSGSIGPKFRIETKDRTAVYS